jgi:phosphatidate cytidylyltransferase
MTRLVSGVALAAAALAVIVFLPVPAVRILACIVAGLAAQELLRVTGPGGATSQWLAIILVVIVCFWTSIAPLDAPLVLVLCLALVVIEVLFRGQSIQDAAVSLVAPVYVAVPLGMLVAVHALHGWRATLLLMGTVVVSDSAQYYSGRTFGKRPLAPAISPKKTVEGAIGGVIFGTLFMVLVGPLAMPGTAPVPLVALGVLIVMLGICGDLFESRLKRVAGVKDSSALIPGHGGILDRIDALLFATPAFYLYFRPL